MSSRRSIFFDLDGTLTDPYEGIHRCIDHALDSMGMSRHEDYRWCVGPPLIQSFAKLVGEARANDALQVYRQRYSETGWKENTPYAGISDALSRLQDEGHRLYVATSKPHVFANRILAHFELSGFFNTVYGAELDGTRGTKTELLKWAISNDPPIGKAIMIGDRRFDIEGAKSNNMEAWGVLYGYGDRQELDDAGADRLIPSVPDLRVS